MRRRKADDVWERRMECLMGLFRAESFAGYVRYVYEKRGASRISCMKLYRVGTISRRVAAGAFVFNLS